MFTTEKDIVERIALTYHCHSLTVGESDPSIPLPNVSASYCEHHRGEPLPVADSEQSQDETRKRTMDISEWDQKFIAVDQEMLFDDVGCKTVANIVKGKTLEEIRKLFSIVSDFTPEEEAQIKKENMIEWAEDR
ncbi:hypothetical protein B0H12DRAFT_1205030 [Mycena haematopus]|nr:hypothetical protein B0H12DRAFT_1205030 [Mycena haematopus]